MKLLPNALVLGLALGVLAVPAAAQSDQSKPAPDVRIKVSLKNGSMIAGVARSGVVWEKSTRRGYLLAGDERTRRCGVRVWYYQNVDGFIFLPARTIADVQELSALTATESRVLRAAVAKAETARKVKAIPLSPEPTPEAGEERPNELSLEDLALLREFPPEKGWGPAVFGEIQRRKIVLEMEPTAEEKRFIEVFPAWEKAWRKRQENTRTGEAAPEGSESEPGVEPAGDPKPRRTGGVGSGVAGG